MGASRDFVGGADYIEWGDFADSGTSLSMCIWMNPDSISATRIGIVSKMDYGGGTSGNSWAVRTTNTGGSGEFFVFIYSSSDGGGRYAETTDFGLTAGAWQCFGFVYDGTGATDADKLKIYKGTLASGVVESSTNFPGSAIPSSLNGGSYEVTCGRELNSGATHNDYNGSMAWWTIDDVVMTESEMFEAMFFPKQDGTLLTAPMFGVDSPEIDWGPNRRSGTITGTVNEDFDGPPVTLRRAPLTVNVADAAPAAGPSLLPLLGVG